MASLRVPAPTPVPTSTLANRRSFHMPLSRHGMPKTPRALSPERPHRFSAIILPNSPAESSQMTPLSPGPMSPPMSAKSFGTFIDSAPSTPAYSPRSASGEWDNSQITILRPMSSSSAPSSPMEPAWEMMAPTKQPSNVNSTFENRTVTRPSYSTTKSQTITFSQPTKRTKPAAPARATTDSPRPTRMAEENESLRKQAEAQAKKLVEDEDAAKLQGAAEKPQLELSPKTDTAPLGKLATRMKSLLRRNTSEKKKKKEKKSHEEFDRLDDVHWSEM